MNYLKFAVFINELDEATSRLVAPNPIATIDVSGPISELGNDLV